MTYAIIFRPDEEPQIWETVSGWPGTINIQVPVGTYAYFYLTSNWTAWKEKGKENSVPENEVPPEYRATVLLFS